MNNQNNFFVFRKLFDSISPIAKKNSKSSNSTRFGDLSINDFSSPNRACRNFSLVQSTISGLRSKTKNLMEKNRRLQTKVQSLQSIISDLQSNCYISDAAADNLKVNLDMLNVNVVIYVLYMFKCFFSNQICYSRQHKLRKYTIYKNEYKIKTFIYKLYYCFVEFILVVS